MRIGIATDHGGFGLKEELLARLRAAGHEVVDFGAHNLISDDDYPDFVIPLARSCLLRPSRKLRYKVVKSQVFTLKRSRN